MHDRRLRLSSAQVALVSLVGTVLAVAPLAALTTPAQAAIGTLTQFQPTSSTGGNCPGSGIVQNNSSDPVGLTTLGANLFYTDAGEDLSAPNSGVPGGSPAPSCQIGSFDPASQTLSLYQVEPPGAVTVAIAPDAQGNLWAVNNGSSTNDIDSFTAQGGNRFAPVGVADPNQTTGTASPQLTDITPGPDGRMWFTEFGAGRIGAINTEGTGLSIFTLPGGQPLGTTTTVTEQPEAIVAGPDGNLWTTVQGGRYIGVLDPTGHLVHQFAAVPPAGDPAPSNAGVALAGLDGITVGPDGAGGKALWFTAEGDHSPGSPPFRPTMVGNGALGMITTGGAIHTFVPPGDLPGSGNGFGAFAPNSIIAGPDGNIYMTDVSTSSVWQFNPTTHAWLSVSVPGCHDPNSNTNISPFSGNVQPTGMTVGPDGNVWFTENNTCGALDRVSVASAITFSPSPLAFGTQGVGTASSLAVTAMNTSGAAISISNVQVVGPNAGDFTIPTNTCGASLGSGASCSVTVQFKPSAQGTRTASLQFTDTGSGSPHAVVLSGTGSGAPTLTPNSATYPDQGVGTTGRAIVFSLSNVTGAPVAVNPGGVSVGGTNAGDFLVLSDGCSGKTVASGSSCAVQVAFRPTALGGRSASLSVAFAGAGSPQTSNLAGRGVAPAASGGGYWLVATDGGIFNYGNTSFFGSTGSIHLNQPIVGMARTPDGGGYWLVASDGGIFSYGDAKFFGSTGSIHLNKPIVGMASTPDGQGYWLVATDGGIFAYGDAKFFGSTGSIHLNKPIVGMAPTLGGGGYWLVASDGGIFNYGDASFHGSAGSIHLNKPIVGMAATTSGGGYYLVATDGGIFAYGDALFHGSAGAIHLNQPIVGMAGTPDSGGYWLVASDGGIFNYGDAGFFGSAGAIHLNKPIVGMTAR
ncbi:MAG TPA: choice-of-anchor D domain-containing protein [Actinomycetota bacterium]|nr:choice-of-anchor D domain-containing protein [Actinomycetota bacterium]